MFEKMKKGDYFHTSLGRVRLVEDDPATETAYAVARDFNRAFVIEVRRADLCPIEVQQ